MSYTKEKTRSVRISNELYERLIEKLPDEIKIGKWIDKAIEMRLSSESKFAHVSITGDEFIKISRLGDRGPSEFK